MSLAVPYGAIDVAVATLGDSVTQTLDERQGDPADWHIVRAGFLYGGSVENGEIVEEHLFCDVVRRRRIGVGS